MAKINTGGKTEEYESYVRKHVFDSFGFDVYDKWFGCY